MKETIVISLICGGLLIWSIISNSNPKNIVAVIYWKSGKITRRGIFPRFSDFEEFRKNMYEEQRDFFYKIDYEYFDKNCKEHKGLL